MPSLYDVPLGQPRFRWTDLDDSSPSYFKMYAAPSDHELTIMWALLACILVIVVAILVTVFLSIAFSPKARRKPFNIYLLFLIPPDILHSSMCLVTCWLSAWKGHYWSTAMCRWQVVYVVVGPCAKAWLNLMATYQVHNLLSKARNKSRYVAPTAKSVFWQSLCVYGYSAIVACSILIDGVPMDIDSQFGFVCFPTRRQDIVGSAYFYLVYSPFFLGIPMAYMMYVFVDVYVRDLLPPKGKSRALTIYFLSINVIFFVCWIPTLFIVFILHGTYPWIAYVSAVLSHCHGAINAILTSRKPDLARAVDAFLCRWRHSRDNKDVTRMSQSDSAVALQVKMDEHRILRDHADEEASPFDMLIEGDSEPSRSGSDMEGGKVSSDIDTELSSTNQIMTRTTGTKTPTPY